MTVTAAQEQPRFRAGANLVRVDAYVLKDGAAVTDLVAEDFEVLEDNVRQRVETLELIQPRGPAPQNALREPNTVAESREMATDPAARVFVLFLDRHNVSLEGSFRAQAPITRLLNRIIGQDDLVGIMTPEMSPRDLTLARRLLAIERLFKDSWFWGQRDRRSPADRGEQEILRCFPEASDEVIAQIHLIDTLNALDRLIVHLENVREDRKFVLLLSEGWLLDGAERSAALGPPRETPRRQPGELQPPGMDPSCQRLSLMLQMSDTQRQFQDLLHRANRANVSFYPVDARGLVVFDSPIGPNPPPPPSVDAARLRARHDTLRTLATVTDGFAIVDTGNIDKALDRMVQDAGAYYLLGYYSSNTKLDGRYRKLTVRVKRPGVSVRARPGYLAPTEAEMIAQREAMAAAIATAAKPVPQSFTRALLGDRPLVSRRGPSTGLHYQRTTDSEFRRTERLRVAIPRLVPGGSVTARLLGPDEKPLAVVITLGEQVEPEFGDMIVADVTLAPLAQAEYELEVSLEKEGQKETTTYRFAIIP